PAPPIPRLNGSRTTVAPARVAAVAVSSVEPSSTTSTSNWGAARLISCTVSPTAPTSFNAGTMAMKPLLTRVKVARSGCPSQALQRDALLRLGRHRHRALRDQARGAGGADQGDERIGRGRAELAATAGEPEVPEQAGALEPVRVEQQHARELEPEVDGEADQPLALLLSQVHVAA